MYSLKDKVVIVTGGANGIGEHIVKEFVKEDIKFIAIIDIDGVSGPVLEKEIVTKYGKGKAAFFRCDVTKDVEIHSVFDKLTQDFGAIDVLVNNAGIANDTLEGFKKEIEINFTATVSSTLKALELMRSDRGGNGGTIINISSIGALTLMSPSVFIYSATKSAVLHFGACVGKEDYYRHTNVRVLTLCFGGTDTGIFAKMKSFDDIVTKQIDHLVTAEARNTFQPAEIAAQGLIHSYKNGKSGSTWLVDSSKVTDITDNVYEAFESLSRNIQSIN